MFDLFSIPNEYDVRHNCSIKKLAKTENKLFHRNDIDFTKLPQKGCYVLYSNAGDVLYVGSANNLKIRLREHLEFKSNVNPYVLDFVSYVTVAKSLTLGYERNIESLLIRKLRPSFNVKENNYNNFNKIINSQYFRKYPLHRHDLIKKLIKLDRSNKRYHIYGEIYLFNEIEENRTFEELYKNLMEVI